LIDVAVLTEYFKNYEATKLHVNNPFLLNSSIYLLLLIVSIVTLKKGESAFLDFSQTEQLKGLAMLFVVVVHFWQHVCNEHGPFLLMGDYAVTLFLLLSGYGLMSSNMIRQIHLRTFFTKRIKKVFVPYWLVTIGIIIADHLLLQKHYHLHDLLLTFVGINVSESLQYFDHARWFITLLLVNYLAFFVCAKLWNPPKATLALLLFSIGLILLRRNELFPLGARSQLLAFSIGCLLAVIGPIRWWIEANIRQQIALVILIALAMLFIYLVVTIGRPAVSFYREKGLIYLQSYVLPYLFCALCILSISLLATAGYISRFLWLCGYLSYELYLIHCALLIKHNPVLGSFEIRFVLLGLILWFGLALGLAYALKTSASQLLHVATFVNRIK